MFKWFCNIFLLGAAEIKCDVENLKPGRNPVWYRKPRFCKRRVWMQVKVKNSRELKR